MRRSLVSLVVLAALAAPGPAFGEGEYEPLYSKAASKVAQGPVDVYCWYDQFAWNTDFGSDVVGSYSPRYHEIDLSPGTCRALDRAAYGGWRPAAFGGKARLASALETLAHEGEHAYGIVNEKKTDCYAMQDMELAARQLGLGWRYGRVLAKFYWNNIYWDTIYWSPKCYEGGPWDIYTDTTIWP